MEFGGSQLHFTAEGDESLYFEILIGKNGFGMTFRRYIVNITGYFNDYLHDLRHGNLKFPEF